MSLEDVFDLLPAGVVALDRDRRVLHVNRAGLQALGVGKGGAEADDVLASLLQAEPVAAALAGATGDGTERRVEMFFEGKDGALSELGLSVVPQSRAAENGANDLAALLVFRVLDVRRSLDQQRREIDHLSAVGRLAAGFAHEVRNPAAAIQALAEEIQAETPVSSPQHELTQRILGLVGRIEALVRTCLDLGQAPMADSAPVDTEKLVAAALGRSGAADRVQVEIESGTPQVLADAPQIVECLSGILANALEASEPSEDVLLRVRSRSQARRWILFEVVDHGSGIPAALLGRVSEPFFTTKPGSTGLGLTVARLVAARHRGWLEVHSSGGETTCSLVLPSVLESLEGPR